MRKKPVETSDLETECLFGESVKVIKKHSKWYYCKLLTDNYCGWIAKDDLTKHEPQTHRVVEIRTFIFQEKNIKANCIDYLPLGSLILVNDISEHWAEIKLNDYYKSSIGYVPLKHIVPINFKINDWVSTAEKLLETPYKWGGRDTQGLDCSALLQLSYQTYGQNIPRNTSDQVNIDKEIITNIDKLKRGFVVFWEGHVGIMVNEKDCIHANAFHMKTVIEPLKNIINRVEKETPLVKILNFN